MIIRWRAVDPGEAADGSGSTAWTRVHVSRAGRHDSKAKTLCGLAIPDMPYMDDMDTNVPTGAPRCKTCVRRLAAPITAWV